MKQKENTTFAERLRHLRELKAKTQTACAKALGVTAVAYGAWERGDREPNLNKVVQICQLFNVSADWLLGVQVDEKRELVEIEEYKKQIEEYHTLRDKLRELMGAS